MNSLTHLAAHYNCVPKRVSYSLEIIYRKIPKVLTPGLFEGFIFGGAYIRRGICAEGNLRFKIDWASL